MNFYTQSQYGCEESRPPRSTSQPPRPGDNDYPYRLGDAINRFEYEQKLERPTVGPVTVSTASDVADSFEGTSARVTLRSQGTQINTSSLSQQSGYPSNQQNQPSAYADGSLETRNSYSQTELQNLPVHFSNASYIQTADEAPEALEAYQPLQSNEFSYEWPSQDTAVADRYRPTNEFLKTEKACWQQIGYGSCPCNAISHTSTTIVPMENYYDQSQANAMYSTTDSDNGIVVPQEILDEDDMPYISSNQSLRLFSSHVNPPTDLEEVNELQEVFTLTLAIPKTKPLPEQIISEEPAVDQQIYFQDEENTPCPRRITYPLKRCFSPINK